ncbi:hypothetical protein V5O48_005149 [Marasmius crinis-equi]|uniref:F-box domain-containing protein n=1 Tax=Marasmius crinis-equi TaxID=585013 RepID=A0ABR3FN58_9AGAR
MTDPANPSFNTCPVTLCPQCNLTLIPHVPHPPITKAESRSQHLLLPEQLVRLQNQITDEQFELERWDKEISRLIGVLDDMQSHRDALSQQLSKRHGLLSASRRLPDELWLKIFSLCVGCKESKLGISEYQWNQVTAESLWLSHVCSRWRDIITSSPSMWSSIFVNLYALERDVVSILKLYLELGSRDSGSGGGKGIDIVVHYNLSFNFRTNMQTSRPPIIINMEEESAWTEHSETAFSFLLQTENMRRFRSLSLTNIKWRLHTPGETEIDFPLLERVFLDACGLRNIPSMWLSQLIPRAPNLWEVVLGPGLILSTSDFTTILTHSQIGSLQILDADRIEGGFLDVVQVLPTISQLEHLRIDSWGSEDGDSILPVTRVECPNLRSLTMMCELSAGHTGPTAFFRCLQLPSLKFLSVRTGYHPSSRALEGLPYALQTSSFSSSLKELAIECEMDVDVERKVFPEILRALPNLVSFSAKIRRDWSENIGLDLLEDLANDSLLSSNLRNIALDQSPSYLDFDRHLEMTERIVSLLESMARRLREITMVLGLIGSDFEQEADKLGFSGRIEKVAERLRTLEEERGMKCGFFYLIHGRKTLLVGSTEFEWDMF